MPRVKPLSPEATSTSPTVRGKREKPQPLHGFSAEPAHRAIQQVLETTTRIVPPISRPVTMIRRSATTIGRADAARIRSRSIFSTIALRPNCSQRDLVILALDRPLNDPAVQRPDAEGGRSAATASWAAMLAHASASRV